jgi:hypothetical protein
MPAMDPCNTGYHTSFDHLVKALIAIYDTHLGVALARPAAHGTQQRNAAQRGACLRNALAAATVRRELLQLACAQWPASCHTVKWPC